MLPSLSDVKKTINNIQASFNLACKRAVSCRSYLVVGKADKTDYTKETKIWNNSSHNAKDSARTRLFKVPEPTFFSQQIFFFHLGRFPFGHQERKKSVNRIFKDIADRD